MTERDWLEDDRAEGPHPPHLPQGRAHTAPVRSSLGACSAACGGDDDGGGGGAAARGRDTEEAEKFTGTLKVTGLGVDLIDPIKAAAEAALGFTLAFDVTDTVTGGNKVVTQPDSLDIFSGYFNDIDQVWPSGNMVPIPIDQVDALGRAQRSSQDRLSPRRTRATPTARPATATRRSGGCTSTEDGELTSLGRRRVGRASGDEPGFVTPRSRATSTWTRWATTATSSRRSPTRSTGPSS